MTQPEFLVHIVIDAADVPPEHLQVLREQEAKRAAELAAAGHLKRLWRLPDGWANIGLWSVASEAEVWNLLDTLPLRRYMTIDVQILQTHPSDPDAALRRTPAGDNS